MQFFLHIKASHLPVDKSLSFQELILVLGSNFVRRVEEQETVLFL